VMVLAAVHMVGLLVGLLVAPRPATTPRVPRALIQVMTDDASLSDEAVRAKLSSLKRGKRRGSTPQRSTPPPPEPAPDSKVVEGVVARRASTTVVEDDGPPPMERLRGRVAERATMRAPLSEEAAAEITTFLNEHLGDEMLGWVLRGTDIGKTAASKNMWSRGSWVPSSVVLLAVSGSKLCFEVGIKQRGKPQPTLLTTELPLARPAKTIDDLRDMLLELTCGRQVDETKAQAAVPMAAGASAVVLRLPGSSDEWSLPNDLWLNTTPYQRSVRNMFYNDVAEAMQAAVASPSCSRLMKVVVTPPELNMEMDSYRVGTLLELVRECAIGFAECGLKTRVCVQGSMGQGAFTGVPRVLSGVIKVLTMMDWQANSDEEYEGMLGTVQGYTVQAADGRQGGHEGAPAASGEEKVAEGLVRFGAVGADEVGADDDVLLVLAPQSMVGASIYEPLRAMAEKADAQGTSIILINPLLQDRQSSSGVMGVRGRAERLAFAASFEGIYHFRLLYSGTTFMFPILGSLRFTREGHGKHILYQRRETGRSESYEPVGCWMGREPTAEEMSLLVPSQVEGVDGGGNESGGGEEGGEAESEVSRQAGGQRAAPPAAPPVERMPWD